MKILSGAQALQSKLELLQKRSRKLLMNYATVLGFTFWSHFRTFLKFPKITHFLTKKCCHTGTTQRDGPGREEGEGFRMGNTCIPVADSC